MCDDAQQFDVGWTEDAESVDDLGVNNVGGPHEESHELDHHRPPSRRRVLGGMAAALTAPLLVRGASAAAAVGPVTGTPSVLAAMHMHASFSEQQGSWHGQASRMPAESVDLMFMTDHSHGLMATQMAADLAGVDVASATTGSPSRSRALRTGHALSLLVETSSVATASASVSTPDSALNRLALRTSVMGQVWRHTFGAVDVDPGGTYEILVQLSHHPATSGRPAGIYQLSYRFGPGLTVSRQSEAGGLTQVFVAPLPASGATVTLDLEADATRAWPDLITEDNGTQSVDFTVTCGGSGKRTAVEVAGVTFSRSVRTPAAVAQVQQKMADTYSARYGVAIHPAVELGSDQHHSAFVAQQYFASDEDLAYTNPGLYTKRNVAAVHNAGGVVSWNHPFGASTGTPAVGAAAVDRRRKVYANLHRTDVFLADLLEVGYAVRGGMGIDTHLDLWDTFSRNGRFLTGNGASDSHDASVSRLGYANEFATGIWCDSVGMGDVLPALLAGRAYTRHAGFWPGGALDLVVDDAYLMGQVVVGSQLTRTLTITATNLPTGSVVEIIASPVDYQSVDPMTSVVARFAASQFSRAGVATYRITTTTSMFVRLTVRDQTGTVIGVSNPVWLLRTPPPGGVPTPRMPN